MTQTSVDFEQAAAEPTGDDNRRLRTILLSVIAVAVLVIAVGAGWLLRGSPSTTASGPSTSSVDAGFARDMSTHHTQAVTMAGMERDATANPALKNLAFDIETSQQFQIGEMQGWLDAWDLTRNSAHPMAWMSGQHMVMGSDGLMPGMATPAQMARLNSATGKTKDVLFLQLMIHHHQGGIPMAEYAAAHASEPYVRTLAAHMVAAQSGEVIAMEKMLRQLGGTELPPPAS